MSRSSSIPLPRDHESTWPNLVGLAAFGLWKRMQAIMVDGSPYGHLTTAAGAPIRTDDLARMVGESSANVRKLLERLINAQVIVELVNGILTSPSMIRAADISGKRSAAGSRGASRTNTRAQAELFAAPKPPVDAAKTGSAAANAAAVGAPLAASPSRGKAFTADAVSGVSTAAATASPGAGARAWVPDDNGKALLAALETDDDRAQLTYMLERVAFAPSWVAEMRLALDPDNMHGKQATPAQIGTAIRHFVGNGEVGDGQRPRLMYFGVYIRQAIQGLEPPPATKRPVRAAGSPGRPTAAYDAGGNEGAASALERQLGAVDGV